MGKELKSEDENQEKGNKIDHIEIELNYFRQMREKEGS